MEGVDARGCFMSAALTASGVSYTFPNGRELLHNLSFSLDTRLAALVGPNGVGKTTLAKILAGELGPTAGAVRRHAPVKLFPQREMPASMTVAEFLSAEYEWSLPGERLLENIDRGAMCVTLSGGEWTRVRLARALDHARGDQYLILDEPTNDLDRHGRDAVFQSLRERKGGALLISHDRECLQLCAAILELSNRGVMKYGGRWSAYAEAKERERERLSAALDLAKRERDSARADEAEQRSRQERRSRHGAAAAARANLPKLLLGARKRRAEATAGKLNVAATARSERLVREAHAALTEMKVDPVMYADLVGREIPARKLVAEAHGFNIRFQDWIYPHDLNFTWRGNVRVALQGANGSGKSTLLAALRGGEFQTRGQLRRGALATLYLDQRCSLLDDSSSVLENVRAHSSMGETQIRNQLARFLFSQQTLYQSAGELSGGERLRAALACGLLRTQQPELMVLDEPTNNLDLANVQFLERIVSAFRGALVVVSHDEIFLGNCGIGQQFPVANLDQSDSG
jgi:ATPase subunit of ABC transporter with duplicated ATPase domains